jgi:hypothetical protein
VSELEKVFGIKIGVQVCKGAGLSRFSLLRLSLFLSPLQLISTLQAKYKRDLASVIDKQEIERDIETKKVRPLAPTLTYTTSVT